MNNSALAEMTILVVDDEPDVRAIVASALESIGPTILQAANGKEALEIYGKEQVDLLVLDVMMPDMSGQEVCEALRAAAGGEAIQILMLTARDGVDDKVEAFDRGADDYLTKPFDYKELQARVKALLLVRQLTVRLMNQNAELERMQDVIAEQERVLATSQLAGTAAHELGQPVSAILLNCHLLGKLDKSDPNFPKALASVESDARRISSIVEQLRDADPSKTAAYYPGMDIIDLKDGE